MVVSEGDLDTADDNAGRLDRRTLLASGAAAAGAPLLVPEVAGARRRRTSRWRSGPLPPLGSGGRPMPLPELARLARAVGDGSPVLLLDLAALDQNTRVILGVARAQGWAVRPALKSFRSPQLISYVLRRLPAPRGLVFNLREVDAIVAAAPSGTDLMLGWPPTFGELAGYLRGRPPARQVPHTVRLLIDSVPLMRELARLATETRRSLPLEVALELDVGMGRGGINGRDELAACLDILRANRSALRLGAVVGYDGHATFNSALPVRRVVAEQAKTAYRRHLENLAALGRDLYDPRTLIRNGPGSSNYRNWPGGPVNEISPGSAFLLAGYLRGGYETDGLAPALAMGGAVRRITGGHPSVPILGTTIPGRGEEEIIVQAIASPEEVVHPAGAHGDDLSGGGDALAVPAGSVALGDYVLYRPGQTEVGIQRFESMLAVREGVVKRRWRVMRRPGGPGPL